jgi:hypothetical protein
MTLLPLFQSAFNFEHTASHFAHLYPNTTFSLPAPVATQWSGHGVVCGVEKMATTGGRFQ